MIVLLQQRPNGRVFPPDQFYEHGEKDDPDNCQEEAKTSNFSQKQIENSSGCGASATIAKMRSLSMRYRTVSLVRSSKLMKGTQGCPQLFYFSMAMRQPPSTSSMPTMA